MVKKGRPKKPEKEKKNKPINGYVTPGEKEEIEIYVREQDTNIADLIRDSVLDKIRGG